MAVGDFFPFLNVVVVQFGYAGMNIISKLAMDSGMNPFVHVAYRIAGSALIVLGLYGVLWGKNKEMSSLPHNHGYHFQEGEEDQEKSTHSETPNFDLESNVAATIRSKT